MNHCVCDERARWICYFKKGEERFVLRFNQLNDMLLACSRAKAIGYTVKTLPAK